jgi:hypothetical protein
MLPSFEGSSGLRCGLGWFDGYAPGVRIVAGDVVSYPRKSPFEWCVPTCGFAWKLTSLDLLKGRNVDATIAGHAELWLAAFYAAPDGGATDETFAFLDAALTLLAPKLWSRTGPAIHASGSMVGWIYGLPVRKTRSKGLIEALTKSFDGEAPFEERRYYPFLEHTGLFLTFAERITHDARGLLSFANKYGCLGFDGRGRVDELDYLHRWYFEAHSMRQAVRVWRLLTSKDFNALSKHFRWLPHPILRGVKSLYFDSHPHLRDRAEAEFPDCRVVMEVASSESPEWEMLKEEDVQTAAQWYLKEIINWHLRGRADFELVWTNETGKRPRKRSTLQPRDMRMNRVLMPRNLLGALWLQLEQAVAGEKEYRPCAECGGMFEVSSTSARADKRICSDACRSRRLRNRIKQAREWYGKDVPIEEIARRLDCDVDTARRWVSSTTED